MKSASTRFPIARLYILGDWRYIQPHFKRAGSLHDVQKWSRGSV